MATNNNEYETREYKVDFRFEGFPNGLTQFLKNCIIDDYVKGRSEVVEIFNSRMESINAAWDKTGKPCSFGDYMEDINPEYTAFINGHFTEDIARINRHHIVQCYLDEYSDVCGTLREIPGSKIYAVLHM